MTIITAVFLGTLLTLALSEGLSSVNGPTASGNISKHNVIVSTLLPYDPTWLFSMPRVREALNLAVEEVTSHPDAILHSCSFILDYRNSRCSISDGINEAINAFTTSRVHVFFGPCCDYSAAPVGRQVKYWKIPMVTAGALSSDFGIRKADMYSLLTRIGPNINSLVQFLVNTLQAFAWRRVTLMYDPDGHEYVIEKFCHIAANGIHTGLRTQREIAELDHDHFKISQDEPISSLREKLVTKIGNNYANWRKGRAPQCVDAVCKREHVEESRQHRRVKARMQFVFVVR